MSLFFLVFLVTKLGLSSNFAFSVGVSVNWTMLDSDYASLVSVLKARVTGLRPNTGMIFTAEKSTLRRIFSAGRLDEVSDECDSNSERGEERMGKIQKKNHQVSSSRKDRTRFY